MKPVVVTARGAESWLKNRLACWKVPHRLANMGGLTLGAFPSGSYLGNPGLHGHAEEFSHE